MPRLCVDYLVQQAVWPIGFSYPDSLAKSRPTGKIQTHWLGHKVVHIVTHNIQKLKSSFHQYFIYIKPWHEKKTVWLTGA